MVTIESNPPNKSLNIPDFVCCWLQKTKQRQKLYTLNCAPKEVDLEALCQAHWECGEMHDKTTSNTDRQKDGGCEGGEDRTIDTVLNLLDSTKATQL